MLKISHLIRQLWVKFGRQRVQDALSNSIEYFSIVPGRWPPAVNMSTFYLGEHSRGGRKKLYQSEPLISILMLVHNTAPDILDFAIRSVLTQSYCRWELCICDNASNSADTLLLLKHYLGSECRLKIIRSDESMPVARAKNLAAEYSTGDFVYILNYDAFLAPEALRRMAEAIFANGDADVIFSDEKKSEYDNCPLKLDLNPECSPEIWVTANYVKHFTVVRKSTLFKIGGFRHENNESEDHDLRLRATTAARQVVHVPHVF